MSRTLSDMHRELAAPAAASSFGKGGAATRRWIAGIRTFGEKIRANIPLPGLLPSVPVGMLLYPLEEGSIASPQIAPVVSEAEAFPDSTGTTFLRKRGGSAPNWAQGTPWGFVKNPEAGAATSTIRESATPSLTLEAIPATRSKAVLFPEIRTAEGQDQEGAAVTGNRLKSEPGLSPQSVRNFISHLSERSAKKLTVWSQAGDELIPAGMFAAGAGNAPQAQTWRLLAATAIREEARARMFPQVMTTPAGEGQAGDLPESIRSNPFSPELPAAEFARRVTPAAEPASGDTGKIPAHEDVAAEPGKGLLATAVDAAFGAQLLAATPQGGVQSELIFASLQGIASGVSGIEGRLAAAPPSENQSGPGAAVRWLEDEDLAGQLQKILRRQALRKGIELP